MTTKPDLRGKRQLADKAFGGLAIGAAALVLLILALIAIAMTNRARPVLGHMGLVFFTSSTWSEHDNVFGALPGGGGAGGAAGGAGGRAGPGGRGGARF